MQDKLLEVLIGYGVFSWIVEMSLGWLFNWRVYKKYLQGKGFKVPLVMVMSVLVSFSAKFDVLYEMGITDELSFVGHVLSAGILAGGSKKINDFVNRREGGKQQLGS